jgi:opacity protein-like surface antigen
VSENQCSFVAVLAVAAALTLLMGAPPALADSDDPPEEVPAAASSDGASADPVAPPPQQADNPLGVSPGNVSGFGGYVSGIGDGIESGPSFGASVAFYFTRNLGIEAGVQRHSLDVTATAANLLSGGTLDSTIATFGMAVRFPAGARAAPYVMGGIAYFSNSFDIDPGLAMGLGAFNFAAAESVDDVLGFQVGGGIDVALGRRIAVFGEARYLGATADTTAGLRDTITGLSAELAGEQDLGRFQAVAGVRVLF